MMPQYLLITELTPFLLQEKVNITIQKGFFPLGGVAIALAENSQYPSQMYCQAMIKMPDLIVVKGLDPSSQPMRAPDL